MSMRTLARSWWRPKTAVERFYADIDTSSLRQRLIKARDDAETPVSASLLLQVATLRSPEFRVSREKRALGHDFHEALLDKWEDKNPNLTISAFPPHALLILRKDDDPDLRIAMSPVGAPDFDWSAGRILLNRVDEVADVAKVWIHDSKDRLTHLERAYAVATQVLASVQRERWRRAKKGLTAVDPATPAFLTELRGVLPQVETAEEKFTLSAEQSAQAAYIRGMFLGAAVLALFSAAGGALLYSFGLSAVIGIGFAAGGLGAVVSVLQRLTTGGLEVDFRAPRLRILLFGSVRPWIGAIFGTVIYALLQARVLGLTPHPPAGLGPELAYYGVFGFISGFNERFAQDVVSASTSQLDRAMAAEGQPSGAAPTAGATAPGIPGRGEELALQGA